MLGPSLLIAPPPYAETLDEYVVSYPKGHDWYDFWTGLKAPASPQTADICADIVTAGATPLPAPRTIHPAA